ncbi:ABC transporter ATP-binding protein [Nocardia flavorosea]|uniref:ABC transporter ATP-binding protein n=1 Tax=Nocardia flavorosea TaxID=53429 RepID=A0A846YFD3_9NOCA|nr:ABC transporter ATP-binding protein [Nocardia flavorosea]NKY58316.1 ABC transporter ATP-binding protein [Nocardia flavorosea]
MIRHLYSLVPHPKLILRLGALNAAQAVLQGLLLGALVPILRALVQPEPDFTGAAPWLVAAAVGLLAYGLLTIIATPIGFAAANEVAGQLRRRLVQHAAQLPLGWFTPENKSRLTRALTADAGNIGQLAVSTGGPAITAVLTPLTIVAVTVAVDWRIAVLSALILPAALAALRRAGQISSAVERDLERAAADIAGRAIELGQAQPVLRAAGRARTGAAPMRRALDEHRDVYERGLRRAMVPDLTYTAVVLAGFLAVLLLTTVLLVEDSISMPEAIALLVLAVRFLEPLSNLIELIGALHAMDNAVGRVGALLDTPTLPAPRAPRTGIASSSIEFTDVTFTYPGSAEPAVTGLGFSCPAGSTTALIGPSGSGKTTITKLIARFFDPDSGSVQIGGVDVRDYDPATLLDHIAIIFQDVYLFDDTIEANLRIANPHATPGDLARVARAARLDDLVDRLPDGWNTRVGEGGSALSGGERQRVSIARALLENAPIVLIDEAASALDPENEHAVSRAIAELADDPGRTVVVIAHRPATLEAADQIITLDQAGRIAETGTPRQLQATGSYYAGLLRHAHLARTWRITARA